MCLLCLWFQPEGFALNCRGINRPHLSEILDISPPFFLQDIPQFKRNSYSIVLCAFLIIHFLYIYYKIFFFPSTEGPMVWFAFLPIYTLLLAVYLLLHFQLPWCGNISDFRPSCFSFTVVQLNMLRTFFYSKSVGRIKCIWNGALFLKILFLPFFFFFSFIISLLFCISRLIILGSIGSSFYLSFSWPLTGTKY